MIPLRGWTKSKLILWKENKNWETSGKKETKATKIMSEMKKDP